MDSILGVSESNCPSQTHHGLRYPLSRLCSFTIAGNSHSLLHLHHVEQGGVWSLWSIRKHFNLVKHVASRIPSCYHQPPSALCMTLADSPQIVDYASFKIFQINVKPAFISGKPENPPIPLEQIVEALLSFYPLSYNLFVELRPVSMG
jgi:hypothetical protein